MKNYIIVSLMFLVSLVTVTSLAHAEEQLVSAEQANLVIYRPNDGSAMSYRLWVDEQYMGKLERGHTVMLQLPAGEHVISANDSKRSKLQVTVDDQGVTYVRNAIERKTRLSLTVDAAGENTVAGL